MSYAPGTVIDNRYTLLRQLGAGGMGEVWVARQSSLDREVALKLMKASSDTSDAALARFQREARAVSKVHHDNVVVVYDTGTCAATGASFIAMELIAGESLRDVVKRGALPIDDAVEILQHVLAGLAAAHAIGIVHRDVKPENVMVAHVSGRRRAKLVDFGIARGVESGDTMTMTGSFVGTPGYTPPEVALGADNNNPKGDLYAVGCIAFELFTGRPVFSAQNALAVAMKHATEPAPDVAGARSDVPRHVAHVVARLLEKDPARRPSATEALALLHGTPSGAAAASASATLSAATPSTASVIASAHGTGAATETATQLLPLEEWDFVAATAFATVEVHRAKRVVRYARTDRKTEGDELEETWRLLMGTPGGIVPKEAGLLVDFRLAPPRHDDAFEAKTDASLKALAERYRRMAILVKSATGRMQAMRNMRERNQPVTVFSDEAEAIHFLTT